MFADDSLGRTPRQVWLLWFEDARDAQRKGRAAHSKCAGATGGRTSVTTEKSVSKMMLRHEDALGMRALAMFQVDSVIVVWDCCAPRVWRRLSRVVSPLLRPLHHMSWRGVVVSVCRSACGMCGATIGGKRSRRRGDVSAW